MIPNRVGFQQIITFVVIYSNDGVMKSESDGVLRAQLILLTHRPAFPDYHLSAEISRWHQKASQDGMNFSESTSAGIALHSYRDKLRALFIEM